MEDAEGSRQAGVPCLSSVLFFQEESCGTEAWQDLISCRSPPYLGAVSCILCTVRNACDCAGWQGACLTPAGTGGHLMRDDATETFLFLGCLHGQSGLEKQSGP